MGLQDGISRLCQLKMQFFIPQLVRRASKKKARALVGLLETGRAAFSQEGEDLVVARLLGNERINQPGFYVDVGAHHPERYSNTMYFYQRQWRGINIDPAPGTIERFVPIRPRDINLEIAVSSTEELIDYAIFDEPALNGCDQEMAARRDGRSGFHVKQVIKVKAMPLSQILDEHMPHGVAIDFLSVDVEGFDLVVLKSNDWSKYRPTLILAEDSNVSILDNATKSPTALYLRSNGYVPVSKCALTVIYAEEAKIRNTELGIVVG